MPMPAETSAAISELPPDLAEWRIIRRDGKMFAVSRHGGTHTHPDDPASMPELIACARRSQSFALAFDPTTNQRREAILNKVAQER
jgi:hypothetical protein